MRKRDYFDSIEEYVRFFERRSALFDRLRSVSERSNAYEMVTLRKSRSGLPVNLYLDDSGSYLDGGHGPRIKFLSQSDLNIKLIISSLVYFSFPSMIIFFSLILCIARTPAIPQIIITIVAVSIIIFFLLIFSPFRGVS